jgi:hypothetical protein
LFPFLVDEIYLHLDRGITPDGARRGGKLSQDKRSQDTVLRNVRTIYASVAEAVLNAARQAMFIAAPGFGRRGVGLLPLSRQRRNHRGAQIPPSIKFNCRRGTIEGVASTCELRNRTLAVVAERTIT